MGLEMKKFPILMGFLKKGVGSKKWGVSLIPQVLKQGIPRSFK